MMEDIYLPIDLPRDWVMAIEYILVILLTHNEELEGEREYKVPIRESVLSSGEGKMCYGISYGEGVEILVDDNISSVDR